METNDFLLYNEVLYRLHACRTMEELKPTLLGQLKLMIPYTYASFLSIQVDPETQELIHRDPFCQPRQFEAAERAWLGQIDQSYSIWLSHAPESMVVRDSEILSGDNRFSAPSYRKIYLDYHIYDCMQMNITYAGQAMGRLAFYRTQADGLFTDREAFLRVPCPTTLIWPAITVPNARPRRRSRPDPGGTDPGLWADPSGDGDPGLVFRTGTRGDFRAASYLQKHPAETSAEPVTANAGSPPAGTC